VRRLILSEQDRVGVGTFQPKDEKNQDSTELTGDINYRKIAEFGSDSDPRASTSTASSTRQPRHHRVHRGAQARRRVPLRPAGRVAGAQDQAEEVRARPNIDEVILGHTNEAEYKKLLSNEFMEAPPRPHGQDRHPYITKVSEEQRIYGKDYNAGKIRGEAHRAAHAGDGGHVGGPHAPRGSEEAPAHRSSRR